jgi:hypothetical protein
MSSDSSMLPHASRKSGAYAEVIAEPPGNWEATMAAAAIASAARSRYPSSLP